MLLWLVKGSRVSRMQYHVVRSLERHGHLREAEYVFTVAQWHEASDGRGLSQLQRCQYNYKMLNFILDEWMPWHTENYDFSTIDVNRFVHAEKHTPT